MTQPTPTAVPPALLNITLGVMLALMLGWFFHIASGVLVPMVLGLMISYVVMSLHAVTVCSPPSTTAPRIALFSASDARRAAHTSRCSPLE